jgi:hypothetical protein
MGRGERELRYWVDPDPFRASRLGEEAVDGKQIRNKQDANRKPLDKSRCQIALKISD